MGSRRLRRGAALVAAVKSAKIGGPSVGSDLLQRMRWQRLAWSRAAVMRRVSVEPAARNGWLSRSSPAALPGVACLTSPCPIDVASDACRIEAEAAISRDTTYSAAAELAVTPNAGIEPRLPGRGGRSLNGAPKTVLQQVNRVLQLGGRFTLHRRSPFAVDRVTAALAGIGFHTAAGQGGDIAEWALPVYSRALVPGGDGAVRPGLVHGASVAATGIGHWELRQWAAERA